MIHIEHLRSRTLSIENLCIEPGTTSVIGRNGSGKTTLLKLCAGITLPETGSLRIDGTEPRGTDVGWVNEFPDRNFLFDTVSDEISSALRFQHIPDDEIIRRTEKVLGTFALNRLHNRSVRELSGGEKVFIALAAAMVKNPRILILDECDSHMDPRCTRMIDRIISDSKIPYILKSTQDMDNAALSDHVIFLETGKVLFSGTPEAVFSDLKNTPFYPISWMCRA
jgi:energy-coupling factor transport system ATP-binding protein